jgi:hypothetical protein
MNAKYRAKHPMGLAAALAAVLALTTSLASLCARADDGNLTLQVHIQQHKSRFQLMLEQVQERASRRAALGHASPATRAAASTPTDIGDSSQSMRLESIIVADPSPLQMDQESMLQFRAQQAYDRDQQSILDHRQQRRALLAGPRIGADRFATTRNELVRFDAQNQQQSLQRKLRH